MNEAAAIASHANIFDMVLSSGPVVQGVLFTLIFLSVWTWALAIAKSIQLRKAHKESNEFSTLFFESRDFARIDDSASRLTSSPLSRIFAAGYREMTHAVRRSQEGAHSETELKMIEWALRRAEHDEYLKLDSGTTFLATVASAAPFVGLFGTVWGIMTAFQGLSAAKSATIQAVAPGISEALVATAVGLAAAIPASVAYNYFVTSIRNLRSGMNRFIVEFMNLAENKV